MKRSEINSVFELYQNIVETDSVIELTEESIDGRIESAVDFFYNEGINDDGIDLIVDDIGLDTFVEFVLQDEEFLNEERSATKAPKRDYAKVKASVYKKDAARKAKGTGEYSKTKAAKAKYGDEVAPEGKPEKKVTVKKVKKAAPAKKVETKAKVKASIKKAKPAQSAKKPAKKGLLGKVRSAVQKGVERHKSAVKSTKKAIKAGQKRDKAVRKVAGDFAKGFGSGVKTAVKAARDVKKVVSKEELEATGLFTAEEIENILALDKD